MKKITVILFLLIYSCSITGATIHTHYCMNELVGWSLWHGGKDNACGKCGMKEKKDGCCKDEHKQVKPATDHPKITNALHFQLPQPVVLIDSFTACSWKVFTIAGIASPLLTAPDIPKERRYLLLCVLLV